MSILIELGQFMLSRKRYWLFPIVIIVIVIGGLTVISQGSALAPFIYSLF
jgi:hypothetical protein